MPGSQPIDCRGSGGAPLRHRRPAASSSDARYVRAICCSTWLAFALSPATTDYVTAARAAWPDPGPATVIGVARTPERSRGRLRQRYRRTWRGLRRHLRRRPRARRCGHGAGGAGGRRAGTAARVRRRCSAWPSGPETILPPEPCGAESGAQGGFSSDGGVRRDRGGGWRRRGATAGPAPARRRDRHCRHDGQRHHRVLRRGRLDQALAPRVGPRSRVCALRAGARRLHGSAHRARRRARPVPWFRAHREGDSAGPSRFRRAMADADAGIQALSLRDNDPSLYRLRPPPACAGDRCWLPVVEVVCEVGEGTVHRLWEPLTEKQRPPNGYAAKFSTPYGIAVGFDQRRSRPRCLHRCGGRRYRRARAGRQGALRDRSGQSLSERVHGPHPRCACATAASSRNANRTCAAGPENRCRARSWRRKRRPICASGGWPEERVEPTLALGRGVCGTVLSIWHFCACEGLSTEYRQGSERPRRRGYRRQSEYRPGHRAGARRGRRCGHGATVQRPGSGRRRGERDRGARPARHWRSWST